MLGLIPTVTQPGRQASLQIGFRKGAVVSHQEEALSVAQIAALFGMPESAVREKIASKGAPQAFFSFEELALRWRCSRGTVRNRIRSCGGKVLDFGPAGKRSKKAVPASVVFQIETRKTKAL